MSYSFSVRAATKAAAKAAVAAQFDSMVHVQPVHAADRPMAQAAAGAFVDLLHEDESKDVIVCVSGSLGWQGEGQFTSTNVSASAYLTIKEAPKA